MLCIHYLTRTVPVGLTASGCAIRDVIICLLSVLSSDVEPNLSMPELPWLICVAGIGPAPRLMPVEGGGETSAVHTSPVMKALYDTDENRRLGP